MEDGRKALKASGFSSFFASKSAKYEKAVEYFTAAANSYKIAKAFREAGDAYVECAACYEKIEDSQSDWAKSLTEAGECYKRSGDMGAAVTAMQQSIGVYLDRGRWNQCGNIMKQIAEMYESEQVDCEDPASMALESWQAAADYYLNESPPREQAANGCLEKVANLSALAGDLGRAAAEFENLARHCLGSKLLKFNARGYAVKHFVCLLATGDKVGVTEKLEEYRHQDQTIEGSREEKFVAGLLAALNGNDPEGFGAAAAEYNSIKKIDPWMTRVLLTCKRSIVAENAADEEEEPEEQVADEDEDLT